MNNFKLRTGPHKIYKIEKEIFEKETFQIEPYYGLNLKGQSVQFAICPQCDNPIEIIGLYKKLKNTDRPYGKHYPASVDNLAKYNKEAYDYCPYASKRLVVTSESRKELTGDFEKSIYYLMREQFDRVIYLLSREIDISIGPNAARKMLDTYIKMEGWLYPWSSLNNLPWVLGHLSLAKSMFGQLVKKGTSLYNAILENCSSAMFKSSSLADYEVLINKPKQWLNIEYCIILHERNVIDGSVIENMQLEVREKTGDFEKRFFSKKLTINEDYFLNLINLPQDRSRRNNTLLDIAKKLMPDI